MKRVTVIGSGNAFNLDGRAHTCYLLESSAQDQLLLDFGATSLMRLHALAIDLNTIPGLLVTHFHGDHIGGIPFLFLHFALIMKRVAPFTVLGPPGIREACAAVLGAMYPGFEVPSFIDFREIAGPDRFESFQIEPYPITHRPESTGYRVRGPRGKTLAFSGDSAYDEKLAALVDGVDVALVELSMPTQDTPPVAHVALEEILSGSMRLRAQRLVWTHIYDDLAASAERAGLETTHDGMVLDFP